MLSSGNTIFSESIRRQERRQRRNAVVMVSMLLLSAALLILPHYIKFTLINWFNSHGVKNTSIDDVDFNPFLGTLTIEGWSATDSASEKKQTVGTVYLDVNWFELLGERLVLEDLTLVHANLDLILHDDGELKIAGLTLTNSLLDTIDEVPGNPQIGIAYSELVDSHLNLDYKGTYREIDVRRLGIGSIYPWDKTRSSAVKLELLTRDASLTLEGETNPFTTPLQWNGHVSVEKLALETLEEIFAAQGITHVSGELTADANIKVMYTDKDNISAESEGELTLANFMIAANDTQISGNNLKWQGTQQYEINDYYVLKSITGQGESHSNQLAIKRLDGEVRNSQLVWNG